MFKTFMRTSTLAGGCAVAAFMLASPAFAQQALRFAHVYEDSTVYHEAAERAAEAIAEGTEGRYTMQVFPSSSLGNEEALNEGLVLGSVDVIYTGPAFMAQSSANIGIADYPFVFRDFDHWQAFWESDLLDEMSQAYTDATGNVLVASTYYGTRQVTANKPILHPSDMQGLKIRVPNAPAYTLFPTATGANPTPMALAEVYLGLQQGVVDAQENPLPTIRSAQFHEVQSDISLTSHTTATLTTIVSGITLSGMSEEDQEVVFTALRDAAEWATQEVLSQEDELVAFFEGAGVTVHEVDRQPFIDVVQPYLVSADMPWEAGIYERLQEIGQ
ncbi:DctP family TRAP transporter solute-binding subunit [Arsenicitalea aurantiaca]|nr:DctP family TRAP transporter solute-binding subunit [Arsenicitalea aurantiaca]